MVGWRLYVRATGDWGMVGWRLYPQQIAVARLTTTRVPAFLNCHEPLVLKGFQSYFRHRWAHPACLRDCLVTGPGSAVRASRPKQEEQDQSFLRTLQPAVGLKDGVRRGKPATAFDLHGGQSPWARCGPAGRSALGL